MDLDRYYTPDSVAAELINVAQTTLCTPRVVADTTCGEGNLLLAAQRVFKRVRCVGTDSDKNAIRRLRAKNPRWLLSVADVLDRDVFARVRAVVDSPACDLLTLNPPFSMSKNRSVDAVFAGHHLRSSVAMAHVLRSLDTFAPKGGAVAIVPESLLFSDIDLEARTLLSKEYDVQIIRGLSNATFHGARANALIVRWLPKVADSAFGERAVASSATTDGGPLVIRGGLPLFESVKSQRGIPLVHSTSLTTLVQTNKLDHCKRVKPIDRGVVCGPVLLFPRVGVPLREYVAPINLKISVQLSDCVFALQFPSMRKAAAFRQSVLKSWDSLVSQYRGTGARYISVSRMKAWAQTLANTLGTGAQ